jgi:hypothetical protein
MALRQVELTVGDTTTEVSLGSYDAWKFEQIYGRSSGETMDDVYRVVHIAALRKNLPVPAEFDAFMALQPDFSVDEDDEGKAESST